MDKELNLLVICTHEGITATILRLIQNHNTQWHATAAASAGEARQLGNQATYDVILLGNGLTEAEEQKLTLYFAQQQPQAKVIKHYGGGSGLLFGEIYQALGSS